MVQLYGVSWDFRSDIHSFHYGDCGAILLEHPEYRKLTNSHEPIGRSCQTCTWREQGVVADCCWRSWPRRQGCCRCLHSIPCSRPTKLPFKELKDRRRQGKDYSSVSTATELCWEVRGYVLVTKWYIDVKDVYLSWSQACVEAFDTRADNHGLQETSFSTNEWVIGSLPRQSRHSGHP